MEKRPLSEADMYDASGNPEIDARFVAFGGEPSQLDNAAAIASATLVAAEQLRELDCSLMLVGDHLRDIATELRRLRQAASKRK